MARKSGIRREESWYGWLFVAPHIVGLVIFTIGAILASGYLSLTKWDLFGAPEWVGLDNYRKLLDDEIFWKALGNTVYYTGFRVPISLVLSLGVALLMNVQIRGILWWRVVYFAPAVSSSVAIALVWRWIYSKDFGLLNSFLGWLHLPAVNWLGTEALAMPAMIAMSVWWSVGTNMVIYLAALQGVPEQLYEAAELDGAGIWGKFRHVTLPLITPTTFFLLIMGTIGSLQIFDIFFVMTQGGPNFATTSLVMYIFQNAFEYFAMGYASAVAWVLFFLILLLSLIQLRFSGWVHYEGERS
ncbi:MAG: ABC transporter permease subunit [Candidatus Latescibacteria bacterium]|nr:ABC transporter permease subunit [Candidatus Latescibacterota bacterium]